MMTREYLGDAVYVEFDGFGFVLTTEDGMQATNRIVLEPDVYEALARYVERVRQALEADPRRI